MRHQGVETPKTLHNLSVLRHVARSIPHGDRWEPVFARYLSELAGRVLPLGGDHDSAVGPWLVYDCCGVFGGFELEDCDRRARFESCDRGVERVVLTACEHDLAVIVHHDPADRRPRRIWLACAAGVRCDEHGRSDQSGRPPPSRR